MNHAVFLNSTADIKRDTVRVSSECASAALTVLGWGGGLQAMQIVYVLFLLKIPDMTVWSFYRPSTYVHSPASLSGPPVHGMVTGGLSFSVTANIRGAAVLQVERRKSLRQTSYKKQKTTLGSGNSNLHIFIWSNEY